MMLFPSPAPPEPEKPAHPALLGGVGDPFVSRLRSRCATCGAEPGVFCHPVKGEASVLSHRGRS